MKYATYEKRDGGGMIGRGGNCAPVLVESSRGAVYLTQGPDEIRISEGQLQQFLDAIERAATSMQFDGYTS